MKAIAWFDELTRKDIGVAGGKGANLGELSKAGFPVPPGFVVTAQAFKLFLEKTGLLDDIMELLNDLNVEDTEKLQKTAKEIQTLVKSEAIPAEISKEIINAYQNLMIGPKHKDLPKKALELVGASRNKEPFVAVRSSATAEDLPEASFAGQQESFVNVKGKEDVLIAVHNCWASLYTARAIYYRVKNKFPHEKVLIAVVVQRMIDSEKSGVAFSINPPTGNKNEIIIEAGWGLGDYVVQGVINPDHYVIDKQTFTIKDKKIQTQSKMKTRDPITGNNIEVELPEKKQNKQVLDDEQIITIARVVKKIEDHYKFPQDIEWASESNRLYILQSRPVTFFGEEKKGPEVSGEVLVKGLPASPGTASGRVKLLESPEQAASFQKGAVLVTTMTNPDWVPIMEKAAAIVTEEGGMTCHAAIVSRELGIPAIVGAIGATKILKDQMLVTVEGSSGQVLKGRIEPSLRPPSITAIQAPLTTIEAPVTGTKVYMNLGIPEKISDYLNLPFDGIGLLRVEFTIASRIGMHPNKAIEEGKHETYISKLAESVGVIGKSVYPKPVIVRFSDFKTNEYKELEGGDKYEPDESNPMLGWRGCSRYISPEFEQAFRLECKAIKRVRDKGLKNVWVMLPFVRTISEVKRIQRILDSEGLERSDDFKVWIMAEVPSVIILADEFSKLCDGFSIGSNDLTQLTLGVDRDSQKLGDMGYFDERDKAVKAGIAKLINCAHECGVSVSICGQAPSVYPEYVEFLVRAGVDSISVSPDVVLKTKQLVNSVERKVLLEAARGDIEEAREREEREERYEKKEDKDLFWP